MKDFCLVFIPALLLTLSFHGCGGGSSGTGGRELDGVVSRGTTPLADVRVSTLPGDGNVATGPVTTDTSGAFVLDDLPRTSTVHLRFESPTSVVLVDLLDIPDDTEVIHMECDYDEGTGRFAVKSAQYVAGDGRTVQGQGVVVAVDEKLA